MKEMSAVIVYSVEKEICELVSIKYTYEIINDIFFYDPTYNMVNIINEALK